MLLNPSPIKVWSATINDKPGGLAHALEPLAKSGANLEFIIARRCHHHSGQGVVYVTPLAGMDQLNAAATAGFREVDAITSLRVSGPDEASVCYRLACALGDASVNLRGLSAGRINGSCLFYLALDTPQDAQRAAKIISQL